jgi:mono/diheme cytochrome c family protein
MKLLGKAAVAGVVVFAALQAVRPAIPAKPAAAEVRASSDVKRILDKDCYSCHSDERRLSWFDQIVPGYWLVRHDILTAREHLNFSTLGSKPDAAQKAALYEAVNMIQLGAMPLPSFLKLHPEAKVTAEQLAALKAYLAPWSPAPNQLPGGPSDSGSMQIPAPVSLSMVQPEFNGLPFDPNFKSWRMLSITDRGDNNTFRFILANDIAVKAAQAGAISPWPDGARFAKVAWQQEASPNGLVQPGKFVQVELMVKNASRYKDTEGWGWGRWRGLDLKPYGNGSAFVNECTGCHQPMRGDDYVYTLPITNAKIAREEAVNNQAAALPIGLPYQPLGWGAITMYVDPKTHTTATLYGNDAAARAVGAAPRGEGNAPAYPTGAVLALVTWSQRDDPHWFGGRIPDAPESVEFVRIAAAGNINEYRRFAGQSLREEHPTASAVELRTSLAIGLNPARLPQ